MAEDSNSKVKDVIEAATGLVQAIPIYDDAIQPAAKEMGKSLHLLAKTVNIALSPISVLVWGFDKIQHFIDEKVTKKLENIPEENIITPDPAIAGPSIEALRFLGSDETLSNMFANLIANSMDSSTSNTTHPGFVEIIKNMNSDEGKILKSFTPNIYKPIIDIKFKSGEGENNLVQNYSLIGEEADCVNLTLVPSYIDNLVRLGLLVVPPGRHLVGEHAYSSLTNSQFYIGLKTRLNSDGFEIVNLNKYIELSELGATFQRACVIDKGN